MLCDANMVCIEILTIYKLITCLSITYLPIYFNNSVKYVLNKHVHSDRVIHKVLQLRGENG
jgi:hypothetical protein